VAKVHFALTVFCIVAPIFISTAVTWSGAHNEAYFQALEHRAWRQAWLILFVTSDLYYSLNFYFSVKFLRLGDKFTFSYSSIWSICFGWIYVKFTNWLNHFPVLDKKVF